MAYSLTVMYWVIDENGSPRWVDCATEAAAQAAAQTLREGGYTDPLYIVSQKRLDGSA